MSATKIEYLGPRGESWNPITGCGPEYPCYERCWARRMANRQRGRNGYPKKDPFQVTLHPDRLEQPFHWRKPRRVAVCFMGDLFHKDVPTEWISQVFSAMAACSQHTFLVLTKRPGRMSAYLAGPILIKLFKPCYWPLPNVWLGVSCSNQADANQRIPELLKCPAAVRYVSFEPLLGAVDLGLRYTSCAKDEQGPPHTLWTAQGGWNVACESPLSWVIAGGESGPSARPTHPNHFRSLRDQCAAAGVPFWFKQWGEWVSQDQAPVGVTVCMPHCTVDGKPPYSMYRVGKKQAGRLLDGQTWEELP